MPLERGLRTCDGGRRHHVNEAGSIIVDLPYALFGGFGCNQHYHFHAVFAGKRLYVLHVIVERQVGYYAPVYAVLAAIAEKFFKAVLHYGVQVAHEKQRYVYAVAHVAQFFHHAGKRSAVPQRFCGGILDYRAVSHGVAERDSNFHHVYSACLHGLQCFDRVSCCRVAGAEIKREYVFFFRIEKSVYPVHFVNV